MERIKTGTGSMLISVFLVSLPSLAMSANPTTRPALSRPSIDEFAVLKSRSIFVKGNQNIAPADSSRRNDSGSRSGSMVGKPESSLVFNGVTTVDDEPQALVEDLSSHVVNTVRAGDGIAGGKVSKITFDGLTYEVNGQTKRVSLGETFDGSVPASGGSALTGSVPSTMPASSGSGAGSGLSSDDIVARLKAKRAAEMGGK